MSPSNTRSNIVRPQYPAISSICRVVLPHKLGESLSAEKSWREREQIYRSGNHIKSLTARQTSTVDFHYDAGRPAFVLLLSAAWWRAGFWQLLDVPGLAYRGCTGCRVLPPHFQDMAVLRTRARGCDGSWSRHATHYLASSTMDLDLGMQQLQCRDVRKRWVLCGESCEAKRI